MRTDLRAFWDEHARRSPSDEPLRRVLRVENGREVDPRAFERVRRDVAVNLEVRPDSRVLDLCCGNGLLTAAVEPCCRRVLAVDFCVGLLREVPRRTRGRTLVAAADVSALEVRAGYFDRALLAAALQHFDEASATRLFRKVSELLTADGVFLVTDVPDRDRIWHFFDDDARRDAYFASCAEGKPILGTWFDGRWLARLARHAGFASAEVLAQPASYPYARYRFDLRCRK
jgi:cyclopropane fatty-acyl-phospholipid synthase-like methyltransferase